MGLLDEAIREHLELRRKHGASDDEIARKKTDALGPVRREALDSGSSPEEETWLSAEETRVIPSPAADAAPSAPPNESPVVPYSPQEDVGPEPPAPEPLVAEPDPEATGWFDAAGGGVDRDRPTPAGLPGGGVPVDSGEPLAPADVFPESNPTVPDERLSADPPIVDAEASVDDLPLVHGEPLEASDSPVSSVDDEPPAVDEAREFGDAPALADEAPADEEPLALTTDGPSDEPLEVEDEPLPATEASPEDLLAEEESPLEDPGPYSEGLLVEEEPLLEDGAPPPESLAAPSEPALEEEPPLEDRSALLDRLAAEEGPPLEEEPPFEDVNMPRESLSLEEERLLADEPPLQEDELYEDEPAALGTTERPLAPEEPEWALDDEEEIEESGPGASPPVGGEHPPEAERDDVLEDTPDFLQETPEHDRLWFEQRPPRDFDFDD